MDEKSVEVNAAYNPAILTMVWKILLGTLSSFTCGTISPAMARIFIGTNWKVSPRKGSKNFVVQKFAGKFLNEFSWIFQELFLNAFVLTLEKYTLIFLCR